MAKLQVFTLDNLTLYDELIKGYIDAADAAVDAKSLKTVAIEGNVLKFYKVAEPVGETEPAYSIPLPETDLTDVLSRLSALETEKADKATTYTKTEVDSAIKVAQDDVDALEEKVDAMYTNDAIDTAIANAKAEATYDDSEVRGLITAEAERAAAAEKVNADAISAINTKIGTVEDGKTVVEMIADAKTAATYDDTEVRELISDNAEAIEAHKTAIDATVTTLVGDDAGKSVRKIANEELAAQLLSGDAEADFQTLQELAAWLENHPEDVATINLNIANLQNLVGTLPEGATSTDVVSYIAEAVAAEKARAEGVEGDLDERLTAVEGKVGEAVDTQITNAIAELDADVTSAAVESGKGVQVQVVEVDGKITTVAVTGNYDEAYDAKGAAGTAETNAKTYADGLNTAMDARATALEEKVGDGYEAIPESEINALFGITE